MYRKELELKELWKETFGDEDEYINRFFSKIYSRDNTLVYTENGKIISMLYMVPYDLRMDGILYKAMYLYALATRKPYRSRGIMSGLIRKAHEIAEERGYLCAFLIPQEDSLFDFYRRFDYTVPFYDDEIVLKVDRLSQDICFKKVHESGEKLWKMQGFYYERRNKAIMLNKQQFLFFLEDLYASGGNVYRFYESGKFLGYVYGVMTEGNLEVYYTDIDREVLAADRFCTIIHQRKRGLIKACKACKDLGTDLNGLYVRNVLC